MDTDIVLEKSLTIQEVAEYSGLSVHTLRYYEKIGLLDPIGRASSGHRRYDANDLTWLAFLMRLRTTGMSIQQMLDFAALRRQGPSSAPQRLAMLEEHRQQVRAHIQELEGHLEVIEKKIASYHKELSTQAEPCVTIPEKYLTF
jgi:DNA-binding transcriptional MerR regulator